MAKTAVGQPDFFSLQIAEARRFHMDLDPSPDCPLSVVSGGREHCQPDYEIKRPGFDYWGIEFVAQGEGALVLGGEDYNLSGGTLFAYGPGIAQDIKTDSRQTMVKYFIDFAGVRGGELLREFAPAPGSVVQTSAPGEVLAVFEELIRCGLRSSPFQQRMAGLLLEYLIIKIGESSIPYGAAGSPAFANYRRCRQVIEDGWRHLQSLNEIADECNLAPAYLCRLFQRYDHVTPYQYLLRLKMSHAAALLQVPGSTVKEVADALGFSDVFHFSRVFKKINGLPPARFARSSVRH
jgi:AraC-like DNA-binding protein